MGGRGRWSGIGDAITPRSRWRRVSISGSRSVQTFRKSRSASSVRLPRSANGTPSAANSPSIQPTPAPKMRRPPESTSMLARSLATGSGDR